MLRAAARAAGLPDLHLAAPYVVLGSVHAVTEEGVLMAAATWRRPRTNPAAATTPTARPLGPHVVRRV
jgi:hypothetical protein